MYSTVLGVINLPYISDEMVHIAFPDEHYAMYDVLIHRAANNAVHGFLSLECATGIFPVTRHG